MKNIQHTHTRAHTHTNSITGLSKCCKIFIVQRGECTVCSELNSFVIAVNKNLHYVVFALS